MPSFLDYIRNLAPIGVNAFNQHRTAGNASNTLQRGVGGAQDRIVQTGADLQRLYGTERDRQLAMLDPYRQAGTQNLAALQAGLQPGGEFNRPFTGESLASEPGYQFTLQRGNEAIEAVQKAMGTRFSGGAAKELARYGTDYANTTFNDAFQRDRLAQGDRFNRLNAVTGLGFDANTQAVDSSQDYARLSGASDLITGQQLADLEMAKSEAEAAGDLGRANAIQDAIEGGLGAVQGLGLVDALRGRGGAAAAGGTAAALFGGGAGPALSGLALGGATPASMGAAGTYGLAGLGATVPTVSSGAAIAGGTAGAGAAGTGAAAPVAAGGGPMSAISGFLASNPWTIPVAVGLIGATAWIKSQAHHEASTFVKQFQDPFANDKGTGHLNKIVDGFDRAVASGQLDKASAQQMRDATAQVIQEFEAKRVEFSRRGSDEKKVAEQAKKTMAELFGPNWEAILGKMDSTIAGLA